MELRVHGVGGPSPQSVLGAGVNDPVVTTWRSEDRARSAVRLAPGDPGVLAYDWRPLTSGSKLFALWPVLLPFSLVNVAGWMHPGWPGRRSGRVIAASRVVSVLLGYAVTVASVLWLLLAGQVVANAPGTLDGSMVQRMPFPEDVTRFWIGVAGAVLAVVVVLLASVHVGRGFGRFRIDATAPRPPRWRVWSSSMPDLRSDRFFDAERDHRVRWRLHAAVVVVTAVGVVVFVVGRGTSEPFEPFADVLSVVGGIQVALLVISALLSLRRPGWWLLSGVGTAAIGVMLVGGMTISALMLFTDIDALPGGRLMMVFDAYGFAVGAGILVAAGFVLFRLLSPLPDIATSALDSGGARRRARLARLSGDVGPVAATVGLTYVVASTVLFLVRAGRDDAESWTLTTTPPVVLGRATLFALFTFMVLNLVKARANPVSLRRVGTVWDVIAFWPRTFHPFAVRPYAERAVPELRVLLTRGGWGNGLQVTAHSQGAVLVHAALLPDCRRSLRRLSGGCITGR